MFLDCPAYLDRSGAARCGLPAAVESRYTVNSTDGPLESAMIRCPLGHFFNGPVESLLWDKAAAGHQPSDVMSTLYNEVRTTFDRDGTPVEHGSHAYLADRYSFTMTLVAQ